MTEPASRTPGAPPTDSAVQAHPHDFHTTLEMLRVAQDAGGIGVFTVEVATGVMQVTPTFCDIFGLPETGSMHTSDAEKLIYPRDRRKASSQDTRVTGKAPLEAEYRIYRANDRQVRWIRRRGEFLLDALGQPTRMVGVVQDIPDRKVAETLLRDRESQFRVLAQAMPNQVWMAKPNGRLYWFNQKTLNYSGLRETDLAGDGWTQIVHPDDLAVASQRWAHSLETGEPYETEFRLRRIDGTYRWHLARALPVTSLNSIAQWIGTNTDIEDHKQTQAELSALNASLEKQVEQRTRDLDRMWRLSSDLMITVRLDGIIVAVNPAWTISLGWREDELVGRNILELMPVNSREASSDKLRGLAEGRAVQNFENVYLHKDGSTRSFSWSAVPDGEVVRAVGRDVTSEQQHAEALRQSEERLRQSQKMESIGQLTGGIAHDFNNLLTGIMGSLDMVRRRLDTGRTDDVERFMTTAVSSAQKAAALTHRLLAFSRRQSLDIRPVDVNRLLQSMEELLRRTLGEQIDLEVILDDSGWQVATDENQLDNALLNLAINARDAMPDGGKLTLETSAIRLDRSYTDEQESLAPGDYLSISVSDTGTGMPPEVIARVFEPFFTTKPIGQGTGLGLSMVYGFVRQSGGHVRIYSEVGQGTTVKLYLPRLDRPASLEPQPEPLPLPRGAGETVLVVEDDPGVRLLVLEVLDELGYAALSAPDAQAALPLLRSEQTIDLMISDVGLPGMSGRQLAEHARALRPGLSILFITGYAEKAAVRSEFLAAGMQMISKPFTMDVLALKVREILQPADA